MSLPTDPALAAAIHGFDELDRAVEAETAGESPQLVLAKTPRGIVNQLANRGRELISLSEKIEALMEVLRIIEIGKGAFHFPENESGHLQFYKENKSVSTMWALHQLCRDVAAEYIRGQLEELKEASKEKLGIAD